MHSTMRFDTYLPRERLRPYVKHYAVSENLAESEYKVLPGPGMVIGFQYSGNLSVITASREEQLASAGITGLADGYKVFKNIAGTGTFLVYFTEVGFAQFASYPANELFNLSVSLEHVFEKQKVKETEEKLGTARNDQQRVRIVEQFLLSQLKTIQTDKLIIEAVKIIYDTKGAIRISELSKKLFISQSPFEKRFRKLVGTTPKKFASVVRFNAVLGDMRGNRSLADICYEHHFFDQAHFIKDFKQFTGDTPEQFRSGK